MQAEHPVNQYPVDDSRLWNILESPTPFYRLPDWDLQQLMENTFENKESILNGEFCANFNNRDAPAWLLQRLGNLYLNVPVSGVVPTREIRELLFPGKIKIIEICRKGLSDIGIEPVKACIPILKELFSKFDVNQMLLFDRQIYHCNKVQWRRNTLGDYIYSGGLTDILWLMFHLPYEAKYEIHARVRKDLAYYRWRNGFPYLLIGDIECEDRETRECRIENYESVNSFYREGLRQYLSEKCAFENQMRIEFGLPDEFTIDYLEPLTISSSPRSQKQINRDDQLSVPGFSASDEFRQVKCNGIGFPSLTPVQAQVVKKLYEAWDHGTLYVHEDNLSDGEKKDFRVNRAFDDVPEWQQLIAKHENKSRTWRLNILPKKAA